jgi:hypothetical protein
MLLGAGALAAAAAWLPQAENSGRQGTLYLSGAYEFAEVDLKTNTAKTWPMLALAGLENSPECAARHVTQSCNWHASETRLDLKSGRIYFVTPAATPGDGPDAEEESEAETFVVWVVGLADLKPIRQIEVPIPQRDMPTILLLENGKKLLMSYRDEDGKSWHEDTIDTTAFAKISTVKDTSGDILNTYFPQTSYFYPNGRFIVSGDMRVAMEGGHFVAQYVDPRAKLPADEQRKLSGFLKTQPDGKKFLAASAAGSANGTTLVMVVTDSNTESAFWTVDMTTGATSPAIAPKYFAEADLLGQGAEVALFEGHMMPPSQDQGYRFEATGHVAIYSVKSGGLERELNMPELKGVGELLCSSADGMRAAYGHGREELLILDLKSGHVTRVQGKFQELPAPKGIGVCEFGE